MRELDVITLDVRDDIRQGREPLRRIIEAAEALEAGQGLEVVNLFEPVPLYGVMEARGFEHATAHSPGGIWRVLFYRSEAPVRA